MHGQKCMNKSVIYIDGNNLYLQYESQAMDKHLKSKIWIFQLLIHVSKYKYDFS